MTTDQDTCGKCAYFRATHTLPTGRVIASYCTLRAEAERGAGYSSTAADTPGCKAFNSLPATRSW